jgi:hypothetical protein
MIMQPPESLTVKGEHLDDSDYEDSDPEVKDIDLNAGL